MKVAVLSKSFAKASDRPVAMLTGAGLEVLRRPNDDPANEARVAELIGDCDGAIVAAQDRVGALVFDRCPNLRVIADHAVGFDRIDTEEAQRRGIVVKTCPGNYESVADLAWLFILATARQLLPAAQSVKDGQWSPPAFSGTEVLHKTIGIIGYGQIGRSVIQRARGFENKILVYDPFVDTVAPVDRLDVTQVSLPELLAQSDVVSLHVPLNERTRNIIDADALSQMKSSATLINTSRGGLVDEAALYQALTNSTLTAAATDVFKTEPPGASPLLDLPSFIATPHIRVPATRTRNGKPIYPAALKGLSTLDIVIAVVYILGILSIGVYFSRQQKSAKDFLLGDKSMGWFTIGPLLATLTSAVGYMSFPAAALKYGTIMLWMWLAIPISYPVVTYVFMPFYHKLNVYTAYEYLERRFSVSVRLLTSAIFILWRVTWMGAVIYVPSLMLNVVTGGQLPLIPSIIALGTLSTLNTTLGGVKAVMWADDEKIILFNEMVVAEQTDELLTDQHAEALEKEVSPVTQQREYYDILEGNFRKLNNRVGQLLQVIVFHEETSDPSIYQAWQYYVDKQGKIGSRAPVVFLKDEERRYLRTEESDFRAPLYKMLLFAHIADEIKAGSLNALYSYRHRAVDDYFLLADNWYNNHEQLLAQSDLSDAADGRAWLDQIYQNLHHQFQLTNQHIHQEQNTHLRFAQGKPPSHQTIILNTPAVDKVDADSLSSLFAARRYTSVLEVLYEVHQTVGYLDCFQHYSLKYKKQRPSPELFIAAIIGYGCNIGIRKVARISKGIAPNQLENVAIWYFTAENIQAANQRLVEMIDRAANRQVPLSEIYRKKAGNGHPHQMHTASDGQKFSVHGHSLNANYSFKYFGSGKGVSVYSFADERSATFHSTVISSSEREAAYVIDGLLHNEVIKSTIHSTDTHGFSEIIFGVTHLPGYTFAPRIKGFKSSFLYSPLPRSVYQSQGFHIFPDRLINEGLILSQWDNILRLIATISLRETTASQIFKRLSSYSNQHPLYQALKEYVGRPMPPSDQNPISTSLYGRR